VSVLEVKQVKRVPSDMGVVKSSKPLHSALSSLLQSCEEKKKERKIKNPQRSSKPLHSALSSLPHSCSKKRKKKPKPLHSCKLSHACRTVGSNEL
jgi:hypothetical protein